MDKCSIWLDKTGSEVEWMYLRDSSETWGFQVEGELIGFSWPELRGVIKWNQDIRFLLMPSLRQLGSVQSEILHNLMWLSQHDVTVLTPGIEKGVCVYDFNTIQCLREFARIDVHLALTA
ncbi:hypothetical protein [Effusibacillus pohliae]|uniref:hypothetical protein n=1 Tax=Effusibacillus pohliae TaxID=232270 RepID=UPI0003620999|nr:hypothetical protein [Effusibacillus pohliae]